MSNRYRLIRRELYEAKLTDILYPNKPLFSAFQSHTALYWILLIISLFSLISVLILVIVTPSKLWFLIPSVIMYICLSSLQLTKREYLHSKSYLKKDNEEILNNYKQYINTIKEILSKYGIDTPETLTCLKTECEKSKKTYTETYNKLTNKVWSTFIGVPIGVLIGSLIAPNNPITPTGLLAVVTIGACLIAAINIIRLISFYTEGYFRDDLMMKAILDIEYTYNSASSNEISIDIP